jgi:hypothetical protein
MVNYSSIHLSNFLLCQSNPAQARLTHSLTIIVSNS